VSGGVTASRSCVSTSISSNGGGLRGQKRKTSADVAEFNALPATQSADLPVRPFGARPAEPAFAAGAPPDAPGATPARALLAFSAVLLLCSAVPVAAGHCIDKTRHLAHACPAKSGQPLMRAPVRKAAPPVTVVLKSAGGGSFNHWRPIAADLMP
jgi:hypothetical protein